MGATMLDDTDPDTVWNDETNKAIAKFLKWSVTRVEGSSDADLLLSLLTSMGAKNYEISFKRVKNAGRKSCWFGFGVGDVWHMGEGPTMLMALALAIVAWSRSVK